MRVLEGKVLENTFLDLDDLYLKDCKVHNCTIYYSGGDYGWEKTEWKNVKIRWVGEAQNTVRLLRSFHMLANPQKAPSPTSITRHDPSQPGSELDGLAVAYHLSSNISDVP